MTNTTPNLYTSNLVSRTQNLVVGTDSFCDYKYTTDLGVTINTAIASLPSTGGAIYLKSGIYAVNTEIVLKSGVSLIGEGQNSVILQPTVSAGYAIITTNSQSFCEISNITIDCQNITTVGGISINKLSNGILKDITIKNVNNSWGLRLYGDALTGNASQNTNIKLINIYIQNISGNYEGILVMNATNIDIVNPYLTNSTQQANGIGIYQLCENIKIVRPEIINFVRGIFYSLSTNNIKIVDPEIHQCSAGITGSNTPDNGIFGQNRTRRLQILGGNIWNNNVGVGFGAVVGGILLGTNIYNNNQQGLVINNGNTPTNGNCENILVDGVTFTDNNLAGNPVNLNPAILLDSSTGFFGVKIKNCYFKGSSTTQAYPVICKQGANDVFNFSDNQGFKYSPATTPVTITGGTITNSTITQNMFY